MDSPTSICGVVQATWILHPNLRIKMSIYLLLMLFIPDSYTSLF